jgi:hypothetical protein
VPQIPLPEVAISWRREGVVVPPFAAQSGWNGHCQMPTPLPIGDDTLRIYYCARDRANRSHVFFADVSAQAPYRVLGRSETPCLLPGPIGHFDAAGVMPTSVIRVGSEIWMYFIGWTVRADVPYHNAIGLAVSRDGGTTFERRFAGPIVGPTAIEPLFCSTADVVRTSDGWKMWYASTTEWRTLNGKLEPRYHLKYADSADGMTWRQQGLVAVDYRDEDEAAVARATVLRHAGQYHMWFCHRDLVGYRDDATHAYRIGYAASGSGSNWQRFDADVFAADTPPLAGIDDVMQAYPAVLAVRGRQMMFYNGNGFGQTGILVATASMVAGRTD